MFTQMTDGVGAAKGATGMMSAPGWCHAHPSSLLRSPSALQSPHPKNKSPPKWWECRVCLSESEYSNVVTQQPVRVDAATACFPRIFVFPVKPSGSSDLSPSQKSIRGQTGYFRALHPLDSLQQLQRKSFSYPLLKCRLVPGYLWQVSQDHFYLTVYLRSQINYKTWHTMSQKCRSSLWKTKYTLTVSMAIKSQLDVGNQKHFIYWSSASVGGSIKAGLLVRRNSSVCWRTWI